MLIVRALGSWRPNMCDRKVALVQLLFLLLPAMFVGMPLGLVVGRARTDRDAARGRHVVVAAGKKGLLVRTVPAGTLGVGHCRILRLSDKKSAC